MAVRNFKRKDNKFADSLVASISSLYIVIISFVFVYAYVGTNLYQRNQSLQRLEDLDKLLALRNVAYSAEISREAHLKDLPIFFIKAQVQRLDEIRNVNDQLNRQIQEDDVKREAPEFGSSKFTEKLLERSFILRTLPMRMAFGVNCEILLSRLAAGKKFDLNNLLYLLSGSSSVQSDRVEFATFSSCGTELEFSVFKFPLENGAVAYAIPRSLKIGLLGDPFSSGNAFRELKEAIALLPEEIKEYAKLDDEFFFMQARSIDYVILRYARAQLGKYFGPEGISSAVEQLFEQKENEAAYFGITAPNTFLVRVGTLIYFALSVELWRRVRRLPRGRLSLSRYWFAFETTDRMGRFYAYFYAFVPLLFGIIVYSVFAISQNLGLAVFGRMISIPGLFTWSFPESYSGWETTDLFAYVLLCVIIPIHFGILIVITRKLLETIKRNLRQAS